MTIHFVSTGPKFPYSYYLGVMTALRAQTAPVKLWITEEPRSRHFDLLKKEKELTICEYSPIPDTPVLRKLSDHNYRVAIFDYVIWDIVSKEGGAVMGLDSLTLKGWQDLLEPDKEMLAPIDAEEDHLSFSMHGVLVRKGSKLAKEVHQLSKKALSKETIKFGDVGITPYLEVTRKNLDKVSVVPFGQVGGCNHDGKIFYLFAEGGKLLHPDTRTIPLYATSAPNLFNQIDENFVANSKTIYAKLVKEVLTKKEWDTRSPLVSSETYDKGYFRAINEEETRQAQRLADFIVKRYSPGSIVDMGCATGLYLKPFFQKNIRILGIDNCPVALDKSVRQVPKKYLQLANLTKSLKVPKADLLLCLETLEHIEEKHADQVVKNLCLASDLLIVTAAPPGQAGVGHLNCQPKEYWIKKFAKHGFIRDETDEETIVNFIKGGYHLGWLPQNVMIFRKKKKGSALRKKRRFRFHIVALPHTITSKEYNACAYTQKVFNFCKMMMDLGHEVYHYGTEGSNPPCTEHITIITKAEQKELLGESDWKKGFFQLEWNPSKPYWIVTNARAAAEIAKRKWRKDFVCLIGGNCQKPIADFLGPADVLTVEYGIGYRGVFAKYRAFESYSHMHKVYGMTMKDPNGSWYDAVIPNYFDPADFPFSAKKDDYFFFIGRLVSRKGPQIAAEVTKEIGAKLLLAGQGVEKKEGNRIIARELTLEGDHLEHIGYADVKKRGELMKKAKAVFVPTTFVEPFGGVAVEAQICGTPVITTDWGAFAETVVHGVTGFRCRTFEQFVWAAKNVDKLDPKTIREWAVNNYSLDRVKLMYQEWFEMLYDLWDKGWYQRKGRTELGWLRRYYP